MGKSIAGPAPAPTRTPTAGPQHRGKTTWTPTTGPFSLLGREHEPIAGITLSRYREHTGPWRLVWPMDRLRRRIGNIHQWSGAAPRPDTSPIGKNLIEENQYAAYATSRWNLRDDLSCCWAAASPTGNAAATTLLTRARPPVTKRIAMAYSCPMPGWCMT